MINLTANTQTTDKSLSEHIRVLALAVNDIIDNKKQDATYIKTTSYFLRHVATRLILQGAGTEMRKRVVAFRAKLEEYQAHYVQGSLEKRPQEGLTAIDTQDNRLRYLMSRLDIVKWTEAENTALTADDWADIKSLQQQAQAMKAQNKMKQPKLQAVSTSNPALLAAGRKLKVDLGQS